MTSLSDSANLPRFWSDDDIRDRLSLDSAAQTVRAALLSDDRFEQPQRMSLGEGRLLVMAARSGQVGDSVVKVVQVAAHGDAPSSHPSVQGVVMCLDASGSTAWVADASTLTVLRTAAMVSLATEVLAPDGAERVTILGAGRQARGQVHAVTRVREVRHLAIWNRTRSHAEKWAAELAQDLPSAQVRVYDSPDEAVSDAQIVCCATASREPLFKAASLPDVVHVNAIGSYRPDMRELSADTFRPASLVVVDDVKSCVIEAGEIIDALSDGAVHQGSLRSLASLLAEPPERREGRTVFKSVGMAVADLAVARILTRQSIEGGAHTS